jgi:uncharacterized protein YcfJ
MATNAQEIIDKVKNNKNVDGKDLLDKTKGNIVTATIGLGLGLAFGYFRGYNLLVSGVVGGLLGGFIGKKLIEK